MSNTKDKLFNVESSALFIEDYKPIGSLIVMTELREMPMFQVKKFSDAVFVGQVNEKDLRDGLGVMIYKNGRIYEGNWKDDQREGKGLEKYSNNNKYEGDFSKGKAHG